MVEVRASRVTPRPCLRLQESLGLHLETLAGLSSLLGPACLYNNNRRPSSLDPFRGQLTSPSDISPLRVEVPECRVNDVFGDETTGTARGSSLRASTTVLNSVLFHENILTRPPYTIIRLWCSQNRLRVASHYDIYKMVKKNLVHRNSLCSMQDQWLRQIRFAPIEPETSRYQLNNRINCTLSYWQISVSVGKKTEDQSALRFLLVRSHQW